MSFEAHGAVQGNPTPSTPSSAKAAAPAAPSTPAPSTPATPEAPAATAANAAAPSAPDSPDAAAAAAAAEKFTTDFKVKVLDQEHEVDEFLRGSIKDQKQWDRVKELYEKALGLDHLKPRHLETKKAYEDTTAKLGAFEQEVGTLRDLYKVKDFDTFFKKLAVKQEDIFEWVLGKAQYEEMTPEQRRVIDERRNLQLQNLDLAKQQQYYQTQLQEQQSKALGFMLNVQLEKQDVKSFAEKFDARAGKPGAFRDAVIEYGEQAYYASKGRSELSPEEAVLKTMERYKPFFVEAPTPVSGAAPIPTAPQQVQQKPRVIPNLGSRSSAPVGSTAKPRSIEDLKKLHKEMTGLV